MSGPLQSRFMPCSACGSSIDRTAAVEHACDPGRRLEYELFGLREGIAALEDDIRTFLASARGRFEAWYAERERRHGPG